MTNLKPIADAIAKYLQDEAGIVIFADHALGAAKAAVDATKNCDMCGKCRKELLEVNPSYASSRLSHVCYSCKERADKYLCKIWKVTKRWETKKMRQYMTKQSNVEKTDDK